MDNKMNRQSSNKIRVMSGVIPKSLPKINTPKSNLEKSSPFILHSNTSIVKSKKLFTPLRSRVITEVSRVDKKQNFYDEVSLFNPNIEARLQIEVGHILQMFKEINKLRQNYGVIEMREEDQDDKFYLEERQITYDASLADMNEQICLLKRKIQEKLERVIKISKNYPKIRKLISKLIEEEASANIEQNLKKGKTASMKAQRRLIEANQREQRKLG